MRRILPVFAVVLAASAGPLAAASLRDAAVGERVEVPAFRYATDKAFQKPLVLRRIDVYAAEARVFVIDGGSRREVPRSPLHFFVSDKAVTGTRLFLAIDPRTDRVSGGIPAADGLRAVEGRLRDGDVVDIEASHSPPPEAEAFRCGVGGEIELAGATAPSAPTLDAAPRRLAAAKAAGRSAVIAVDTDNEFLQKLFANNTSNATNYIATLFASMNTMYERDLDLTLQQGDVFLRVSTTADPYTTTESSTTGAQLDEFAEYWRVNMGGVQRTFAMQLSGKSPSGCSSAGIAWVLNRSSDNYCASTGVRINNNTRTFGHYSVSRVFNNCGSITGNATFSAGLVGHELGHNFGARHTHCTAADGSSPTTAVATGTIDACYNGEADSGCYAGTPSCPSESFLGVSGQGTVMSYCNFSASSGGAACAPNNGQVLNVFHPTHQTFLMQRIQSNVSNGCITTNSGGGSNVGPTLTAASPASGSTTAMSGGVVGAQVTSNITFNRSGGSGSGTTTFSCSVAAGTVQIASGSPQTIVVGGTVAPVVARFTLTSSTQQGTINCTATPQGGSASSFTYNFTAPAGSGSAPVNNNFANATTISGNSATVTGSNVSASKETGEFNHDGNAGGASVWWQWTAVASGSTTIDTIGSSFDTLLAVYTGNAVGSLTAIASNDDISASVRQSRVTFTASAGTTYRIAVDGYNGGSGAATGSITLTLAGQASSGSNTCSAPCLFRSGFE